MPRQPGPNPPATRPRLIALLLCAICLAMATSTRSQNLSSWVADGNPPPPSPESPLLDNAGLFDRDPDSLNRLSAAINDLRSTHGFNLIVVIESVLMTSTPTELAAALQSAWIDDGNGLIVVFEADSRRLGFGRSSGGATNFESLAGHLPSYEVVAVLGRSLKALDTTRPPQEAIDTLVTQLCAGFSEAFSLRDSPPPAGHSLRRSLVAIGGFATLALATLMLAWLLRRDQAARPVRRRFLPVSPPQRLGAPYGGGTVSSRRFVESSAPPP